MNTWIKFSWIPGLVLFGFGLIGAGIVGFDVAFVNPLILAHLVIGVVTLIVWFATSGVKSIGTTGELVTGRAARFSYNASIYIVVFLGILAVGNWFANSYNKRWDLTEEGAYSLSSQSVNAMKALNKPLKLVGVTGAEMTRAGHEVDELKDRFALYKDSNSSQVTTELFDPRSKPNFVEKYGFKPGNLVYIEYGEGDSKAVSRINEASEEAITNAVVKLQRGVAKKLYYLTGHGEPSLKSVNEDGLKRFADSVADEHLVIEDLFLAQKGDVPTDASAVILVSPQKSLGQGEKDSLIKYAENGGHLLLLSDPRTTDDIKEIASHFGIEVGKDVVIDQIQRLFEGPALGAQPVVRTYGQHPIARDLTAENITIFNLASTVTAKGKSENGVTYTDLLKSSPSAWGETNLELLFGGDNADARMEESDVKGPVTLGVVYEKKIKDPSASGDQTDATTEKVSRVVVIGDSDWILNPNLNVYSNRDLIMNCINWIAGEESGISIRPRSLKESVAPITEGDFLKILTASFLIPELILLTGLMVWWRRKTVFA